MRRQNVRALILDYGGVLSLPQDQQSVDQMAGHLGVDRERFRRVYRRERPAFDRGAVTGEQYWRRVVLGCDRDPANSDLAYLIALDVQSWTQLNEKMVGFVADCGRRVLRLAMLSNMTQNTLVVMRQCFGWLDFFDVCVFSCEIGVNKPDGRIYQHCLEQLELGADECLFVDDSTENVEGARNAGMAAIRFERTDQFLAALEGFHLAPG